MIREWSGNRNFSGFQKNDLRGWRISDLKNVLVLTIKKHIKTRREAIRGLRIEMPVFRLILSDI